MRIRPMTAKRPGLFLFSEKALAYIYFNETDEYNDTWKGSDAQKWCLDFAANPANFTPVEQGAMFGVDKADSAETLLGLPMAESSLESTDNVFFLSFEELMEYVGNYDSAIGFATDYRHSMADWWTRSPYSPGGTGLIGAIADNGTTSPYRVSNENVAARPAFNLAPDDILFISAAEGGKPEGGLQAVPGYEGNEWKLTMKDAGRSGFTAACTSYEGGTATIDYTGAQVGDNEYISAIIADGSGAYTHYSRLAKAEAAGTVTLDLSSIDMAGKTLYIFNEQYNGDYQTDYASALKEVSLVSCEHTFGEWIIYRYPTKTEPGENKRFCTKCKYAESQITPALGEPCAGEHVYGTEWSFNDLFHWHTCIHCGQRDIGSHRIEGEATECAICRTPVETSTDDFFVYEVTASIYGEDGEWIEDITHTVPLPVERTKEEALQKARDIYLKAVVASEYPDTLWEEQPYEDAPKTNADTGETETDVLISISLDGKSLLRSIYEIHEAKFKVTAVPSVKIQMWKKARPPYR